MANNAIVGCSSTELTKDEVALFADMQPWGLILFSRNIDNREQVIQLIEHTKHVLGRKELMVFIDQEGGRVSRLPKENWRVPPSPTVFARMYASDPTIAKRACFLNALLTAYELKELGINVNCAPMLDIAHASSASIISERSLGNNIEQVIDLAVQIINGLKRGGVAAVIKHIPGHGRATSDSHLELPIVDASIDELSDLDFMPFATLNNQTMAMTAHVVFSQIDAHLPATISKTVIQDVIRLAMGFNGLLMTDDINMQALSGDIAQRGQQAIEAGCDIILHCSGKLEEMISLSKVLSPLSGQSLVRAQRAESQAFTPASKLSTKSIELELSMLLANYS